MTPSGAIGRRAAGAARWRAVGAAGGGAAQLLIGVALARILPPAAFGLVALALIVQGFVRPLADCGIGNAIVQRDVLTDRHIRVGFTLSLLVGMTICAALNAVAPLGGWLLKNADVVPVLRALSIVFVVSGAGTTAAALLRRDLDFRTQCIIDLSSYVIGFGAVAFVLALRGHGVWSLVAGSLAQATIAATAQMLCVRHSLRPLVAKREVRELVRFGAGSAVATCVNYVAVSSDNLVAGRMLGPSALGLYSRAYALMNVPHTYGSSVMSSVLFPALARLQHDAARLRKSYLVVTRVMSSIAAPAMITLAVAAPYVVTGLYGPRWAGVVAPLQILCVAGYFRTQYHLGGIVAQSVGRVYSELRNQVMYASMVLTGAIAGARFGLIGVAVGVACAILGMFVLTTRLALEVTGVGWSAYLRVQRPGLVTAAWAGAAALAARRLMTLGVHSNGLVAIVVVAAAAIPSGMGVVALFRESELFAVTDALLTPVHQFAAALHARWVRHATPSGEPAPI